MGSRGADRRQPRGRARSGFLATLPPTAKIEAVHRSLEQAGISHAFGGAIALSFYAEPRETKDIDVNVFMPTQESELKLDWKGTPVHFFFSCDPLHEEMEKQIKKVPLGNGTIPLVAPEHLVIRKTLLGRPKDLRDIEAIAAAVDLDWEEIEGWVQRLADES
ncbi:MAG TPA: hypothetical protein VJU14_08980 [Solirubrobacterales bacterium]|nr:hypothetical protein [Solirubrobacterales bacterium]